MIRKDFLHWLLLLLLLTTRFAVAADSGWLEVRSEHFRVLTDAGEKNGCQIAEHFEQMHAAFGLLFGREKINEPVPLQIIAFRNTKELRQYSPIFHGKVVDVAGFFVRGEDKNFVAIDMSRENSWEIVMHEYAHVLLNSNYMPTAPWFDEGFAEFFSSMKVADIDVQVGAVIPEARALLQGKKLSLLDLLQVQHHSETYYEKGQRRDMFYAESWLVVHYLFDTGQVPKAVQYFALTNTQKVPVPEAVQSAFGMPVSQLEKVILDYLRADTVKVKRYTFKHPIVTSHEAMGRPLDPLEARAQLADLHLHEEEYGALAVKEFEAVVREDPNQVEAQQGLGYAYLRERNFAKATEHLQAAVRLGSKDPRVYFYTAVLLQEQDPAAMGSPELAQNLRRAIELDPQYADACALLGVSLLNSGSYAEAEANLARAVSLSPRNDMYRLNYAISLLDERKVAEAKTALSFIVHSSTPQVADQVAQMLQQINRYESRPAPEVAVERRSSPAPDVAVGRRSTPKPEAEGPSGYEPTVPAAPAKVGYLKGTLVDVDCSTPPLAVLTVTSAGKTWKMKVANSDHVVLIGADKFSCLWSHKKVALNYSPTAANEGRVISVEIQ